MSDESKRTIKVQSGAINRTMEVPAGVNTVGELRAKLGRIGVTSDHAAFTRGEGAGQATAVSDDTVISDGMSFEFSRNTGQKG